MDKQYWLRSGTYKKNMMAKRIAELTEENERLRKVLAETVPIMERSVSYIEDFAKPLPPKLQREIINMIIHASDAAIDAAREGE
jgi:hypothetical protein